MSSADEVSVFPAHDLEEEDNLSFICRALSEGFNSVFGNDYSINEKICHDDPLGRPEITVGINSDWTVTQDETNNHDRFDSGAYGESEEEEEEDQVEDDNYDSRVYYVRDNPAFFTKFNENSCDSIDEQVVPTSVEASPVGELSLPASPRLDNEDVNEEEKKEETEEEEEIDRTKRKERDRDSESEDVENHDKQKDDELVKNSTAKRVHLESEAVTRSQPHLS
ncbi:origin recognition complex subunit 1-like [Athalia rosae]|uniref:origin recognition complex subunit 1-like n=1 Tax=Athalia rosae TaxID=37344 RepID=UPI0020337007|nr:origin recognition complex subunit 1-like [Athalia rosae]XP_048506157.1 origin recognition complex subunit 1-like [Athalia rosae]